MVHGYIGGNLAIIKYIADNLNVPINNALNDYWFYPYFDEGEHACKLSNISYVEVLSFLVGRGAQLLADDTSKPYHWAAYSLSEHTLDYFISQGLTFTPKIKNAQWSYLSAALDNSEFLFASCLLHDEENLYFRGLPLIVFFADGLPNSPYIINFLIKNGINRDYYSQAFLSSVAHDDARSVKQLLDAGADVNYVDDEGFNSLHYVKSDLLAKYLAAKGVDVGNQLVLEQAWRNTHLLKVLDSIGVKPPISQEQANEGLWSAATLGNQWAVSYFLSRGAQVNEWNKEGYNALMANVLQGYSICDYSAIPISDTIVRILAKAGTDINAADKYGKTALHYACGAGWCRIALSPIPDTNRQKRENGCHGDPAVPPKSNRTLQAKALVDAGAKLNEVDMDGNTPLILAAESGNNDIVRVLLEAGADATIKNKKGKTAIVYTEAILKE